MDNKYLIIGGVFLIAVIIGAGLLFSFGGSGITGKFTHGIYEYPDYLGEPNGNNLTIIAQLANPNTWNSKWVVCSENYLGGTPMSVRFDSVPFTNGVYEFETKKSGNNAKMDVSCFNYQNNQQVAMKTNWVPANRQHRLSIPAECLAFNVFNVTWTRKGGNCLKFKYMRLYEYQAPKAPDDGKVYPSFVGEPNGNGGTILTQLWDTNNLNSKWVVCSGAYLGDTPMQVDFSDVNFSSSGIYEFRTKRSGGNAKMDVSCIDYQNGGNASLKSNWLPGDGTHRLSIPDGCLANGYLNMSWSRVGGNCLKFYYMRLYETQNQGNQSNCSDSDNGAVANVFGNCTHASNGTLSDSCVNNGLVQDYVCSQHGDWCTGEYVNCAQNTTCNNGFCS